MTGTHGRQDRRARGDGRRAGASPPPQQRVAAVLVVVGGLLGGVALVEPAGAVARAAAFDVNGDGYADLVTGVPGESVGGVDGAGAVSVLYGGPAGVTATGNRLVHQGTAGVSGANERGDSYGTAVASADFDRDGYADLAVGIPGDNRVPDVSQGAVSVLYGSPDGPSGARDQRFSPAGLRLQEAWAAELATGDLNGDGYADLAVSPGGARIEGHPHGAVTVLYGSARGLVSDGFTHLSDATAGDPGSTDPDGFGRSLAVGDLTGDGTDDLVVATRRLGVPGISVFHGRDAGLATRADQHLSQGSPSLAVPDTTYEALGDALAIGDFDGDGHGDLAAADVGAAPPGFATCRQRAACPGAVLVLPGADEGVDPVGRSLWFADSPGVPGVAGAGNGFGVSIAGGDLDADGRDDLAVGITGQAARGRPGAGAVDVLYGSGSGLSADRARQWTQDTPGVPGGAETGDFFGRGLRISQLGRSSVEDLAVWADGESIRAVRGAGSVTVLTGWRGSGVRAAGSTSWNQGTAGVVDAPEEYDAFGLLDAG